MSDWDDNKYCGFGNDVLTAVVGLISHLRFMGYQVDFDGEKKFIMRKHKICFTRTIQFSTKNENICAWIYKN